MRVSTNTVFRQGCICRRLWLCGLYAGGPNIPPFAKSSPLMPQREGYITYAVESLALESAALPISQLQLAMHGNRQIPRGNSRPRAFHLPRRGTTIVRTLFLLIAVTGKLCNILGLNHVFIHASTEEVYS
jgi:hypothetical protein